MRTCVAILFFVLSIGLKAGDLPQGDQYATALTQKLDAVISAYALFGQSVEESRPPEEVAHSLESLADQYDWLCAQVSQFCAWCKNTPGPTRFSESGLVQIGRFVERSKEFGKAFQETRKFEQLMTPYQSNERILSAERRIMSSYRTMQGFMRQGVLRPPD
jgi:hypothetical protein